MKYAHGAIQWLASDGATSTYPVTCTDVNGTGTFQPKAIKFSWSGIQSASNALSEALHIRRGRGFCVSTSSRRACVSFDEDAADPTNCGGGMFNDCVAVTVDGSGAADGKLDVSAFTSDGFTAIVDDATPVNMTVFWEAWGGDDITVAAVGDIAEPGSTGNVDYTVTGFSGSAPAGEQVVMFAGCQSTAAVNTAAATDSGFMVGYATGSGGENIVIVGNSDDASATTDTDSYCQDGECLAMIVLAGGNTNARASLTQFGTDNFRLNWAERGTTNRRYCFLAIRGGQWRAGSYTIDALTLSATATVSSLPFRPLGISLIGTGEAENTSDTSTTNDRMGWGCGSSTSSRRSMGVLSENGSGAAQCDHTLNYDCALSFPDASAAIGGAYDINAMNADGFQIIVDDTRASATEWQGYLAFGSKKHGGSGTPSLPLLTASGEGDVEAGAATHEGSGAATLPLLTASGTGKRALKAPGAASLPILTASGVGKRTLRATGTPSLPILTASGAGKKARAGTGAATLPVLTASGTGKKARKGAGTPSLPILTASGAGKRTLRSTGTPSLPLLTASGVGDVITAGPETQDGSGAATLPLLTASGSGKKTRKGTGACALPVLTASGVARRALKGVGAVTLPILSAEGAGKKTRKGDGALDLPFLVVTGTGRRALIGSGALSLPLLLAEGEGQPGIEIGEAIDARQIAVDHDDRVVLVDNPGRSLEADSAAREIEVSSDSRSITVAGASRTI